MTAIRCDWCKEIVLTYCNIKGRNLCNYCKKREYQAQLKSLKKLYGEYGE